jgi:L-threonylcarbamoyladenylate synthase
VTPRLPVDPRAPEPGPIARGVAVLSRGGTVAFPTETFYGLGADARRDDAVARVFAAKGRPEDKPLLVLVDSEASALALAAEVPEPARALMARHWPGPLTLVFRARPELPARLTAGTGTVGVRVPGHPVALALVRAAGCPVTAPSANPSGGPPPRTADEVQAGLDGKIDLILDGGATAGGQPSTVADCTAWPPRILRQGAVRL